MPSLTAKDRVSLCLFTFTDGRRCRTPRISSHPHFCFYHAQKESQSQATAKLAKDLAYFFSGDYLSANDLNTALGRLIPAVVRGEIKPRVARTVAYMLQTLPNPPAWPNTNTSTPSAPTPGAKPSAPPSTPTPAQTAQPNNAPPAAPLPPQSRCQQGAPNREPHAVHFDHTHRLLVDGKPW